MMMTTTAAEAAGSEPYHTEVYRKREAYSRELDIVDAWGQRMDKDLGLNLEWVEYWST
jgi:hypothetical protein